ncbi:cysteine desulfurase family protein [Georgenia sp. Z1344]|uniref:cysteine desulfurase family protein n=1 Tax=Georgenia sp. Z1344 TaxID=3416706 RepID=UPI003CF42D4A
MRHYLDHAAATDLLPEAAGAHAEELARQVAAPGNPSSGHAAGRAARARWEEARERIAAALVADAAEVVLTSGATEADTLAITGVVRAAHLAGRTPRCVAHSAVEHPSVLRTARYLEDDGLTVAHQLPVHPDGRLDLDAARDVLSCPPALFSVTAVCHETGVVQPLAELVGIARSATSTERPRGVPVHTDASQALGVLPVRFHGGDLDAMTIAGPKVGAPVGTGALIARRDLELAPVGGGGGQQRSVRSGTLDVAGAVALAVAVEHAVATREAHAARLSALRADLVSGIASRIPGLVVSGPDPDRPESAEVSPAVVHVRIPGADPDALLLALDAAGIDASPGAACTTGVLGASDVLLAMGLSEADARTGLRLSMGRTTTPDDVAAVVRALPGAAEAARAVGALSS